MNLAAMADEQYIQAKKNRTYSPKPLWKWLASGLFALAGIWMAVVYTAASPLILAIAALAAALIPYFMRVAYYFFCSSMERYAYRSGFAGKYLKGELEPTMAEKVKEREAKASFPV